MSFADEHAKWLAQHLSRRRGERRDALKRGHGYGNQLFVELIWWKLMGHFEHLHPEYEVKDWRGRSYFVDFIWILGGYRIIFEIMDYGSHGTDRSKYRLDLNRALFLQSQDHRVIFISLDELKENPFFILSMVRHIISPYLPAGNGELNQSPYSKVERQLMRLSIRHNRVIYPVRAAAQLDLHKQTVIKYCRTLVDKGKFRAVPTGRSGKVYKYEYIGSLHDPALL